MEAFATILMIPLEIRGNNYTYVTNTECCENIITINVIFRCMINIIRFARDWQVLTFSWR